jgi:nitrogenase-stabilizing/protective protein
MPLNPLDGDLQDLSSAEEFLDYFKIGYDQKVVHVNRLHILQRFHDYLARGRDQLPEALEPRQEIYKRLLARAYQDFVESDALTEKVFAVFHEAHSHSGNFVALEEVGLRNAGAATGDTRATAL